MRDRVSTKILDNGATRYGVYDEDGNLLRYEYIKLEDEPEVEGDFFSKANMLPDHIPALLGLKMGNPQVKDALNVLANIGNVRVWARTITYSAPGYTLSDPAAYEVSRFYAGVFPDAGMSIQYASGVSVSSAGIVSLNNPATLDYVGYKDELDDVKTLAGKFCVFTKVATIASYQTQIPGGVVYIPNDAQFSFEFDTSDIIITCSKIQIVTGRGAGETTDFVTSTDSTAYPQDGDVGDYHYTYLGQMGDKARIEVGSYVGTGKYGSAGKCSVTLSFEPKFFHVLPLDKQDTYVSEPWVYGSKGFATHQSSTTTGNNVTVSGTTISWYGETDEYRQRNASGKIYRWIALG